MVEWFPSDTRTPEQSRWDVAVAAVMAIGLLGGSVPRSLTALHALAFCAAVWAMMHWSRRKR